MRHFLLYEGLGWRPFLTYHQHFRAMPALSLSHLATVAIAR